jgi:soluble lytic murein transglycosylase-like protein
MTVRQAAQSSGLDVGMLRAFTAIESGGNPSARTGRYHGLFQLSQAEFAALGGKNIYDPYDNARIAASEGQRPSPRSPSPMAFV